MLNPWAQTESPSKHLPWTATYFETMSQEHKECSKVAQGLAQALQPGRLLPERANAERQEGPTCGFWTVHYAEEVARRRRGEGSWTLPFNLQHRVERLNKLIDRLAGIQ